MIKNSCQHEWEKHTDIKANGIPSTHICKKCNSIIASADVFQLEALENQTQAMRDQNRATSALVTTTIIAFSTLILVAIGFYFDYIK